MADASVSLKLTPGEFKMVQDSLAVAVDVNHNIVKGGTAFTAEQRSHAREKEMLLRDLLGKLTK